MEFITQNIMFLKLGLWNRKNNQHKNLNFEPKLTISSNTSFVNVGGIVVISKKNWGKMCKI